MADPVNNAKKQTTTVVTKQLAGEHPLSQVVQQSLAAQRFVADVLASMKEDHGFGPRDYAEVLVGGLKAEKTTFSRKDGVTTIPNHSLRLKYAKMFNDFLESASKGSVQIAPSLTVNQAASAEEVDEDDEAVRAAKERAEAARKQREEDV